jgi:High potential iron-sulfur protein
MSDRISRGEIISLLAGLPLAVAATTGVASAADDSSGTKAQYKYVAKSTKAGQTCSGCSLFKPPAACNLVKGKIAPGGWCIAYAPKAK